VSTARRAVLVLALIAAMVVALSGMASAEPPDHANASCFGKSESVDKEAPGPGEGISDIATSAAHTRTTPVAAQLVPFLQESTHTLCQQGQ
jgi:hypothetical protein